MRTGCLLFTVSTMSSQPFWPVFVGSHRVLHKTKSHSDIPRFLIFCLMKKPLWQQKKNTKSVQTHRSTTFLDSWGFVEIRGDSWRFVEIRGTFVEIRGTFVEIRGPYICVVFNIRGDSWGFVGFRGVSWALISEIVAAVLYKIPRKFSTKTNFLQK